MDELDRRRILLVEDEYMLAKDLQDALEDVGVVVLGPEPSVGRALVRIVAESAIDAAILDVNLGGEPVFPVADALLARRVPFVFASGYEDKVIRKRYPEAVQCDKPLDMRNLLKVLQSLMARR